MKFISCATVLAAVAAQANGQQLRRLADSNELVATFDFDDLQGTVTLSQTEKQRQQGQAGWSVKITHWNDDICPGGQLNWHIHEFPGTGIRDGDSGNADGCAKGVTGGHFDPTFACGGASQNKANGICDFINDALTDSYADCSSDAQYNCEVGDQSNKMGKVDAQSSSNQIFEDNWITDLDSIEGRSLVFHCCTDSCSPRMACANLERA